MFLVLACAVLSIVWGFRLYRFLFPQPGRRRRTEGVES